ncbi:MAG TPA: Glu/Leu/Phe/Val dehydrogenase dimerization domain-containing protein [Thermoleophilaceae bacterium]|jgi:glutamate dehydrogenase/leucine dehydrogenase
MTAAPGDGSTVVHTYSDPEEGFEGYLAYSGEGRPLAAGGFRVQRGLSARTIRELAEAMKLKEGVLQLNVDGAKCGIDYDPGSSGKHAAMRRFLRFLAPHLAGRLSLGPDMGTTFPEIEALAREEGIASVKGAIARAQGLPEEQVLRRLATLDLDSGPLTVGSRRAGHALAHATFAAMRSVGLSSPPATCALEGFGTLGRGAALTLHEAGMVVTAVADEHGCISRAGGLDLDEMLRSPHATPVPELAPPGAAVEDSAAVLALPADVLVLAAREDALSEEDVERVQARVVVVGANNGLRPSVEEFLFERGVLVVPDFVGGSGGSASMDALFGPPLCPDPVTVLTRVAMTVRALVEDIAATSERMQLSPRTAALALAADHPLSPDAKPYGMRLLRDIERVDALSASDVRDRASRVAAGCAWQAQLEHAGLE